MNKQKIALVTGGSRGIGRAIVEKLAANGVGFIGVHYSTNITAANEVVAQVKALGGYAVALQADFSSDGKLGAEKLWRDFAAAVKSKTGEVNIDILVNSAGILYNASLKQTTVDIFKKTTSINVEAPFFLIQEADDYLRSGGRIINLSSSVTRYIKPNLSIYSASKAAISSFTLSLAGEFGPRNITVNAVAPGVTDTDMNSEWLSDPKLRAEAEKSSVFSRLGQAKDIANLVGYLASDDSGWTTGQVIDVSGGTHLL